MQASYRPYTSNLSSPNNHLVFVSSVILITACSQSPSGPCIKSSQTSIAEVMK